MRQGTVYDLMRCDREGILELLREAERLDGRDIHLRAGGPPAIRVQGQLTRSGTSSLTDEESRRVATLLLRLGGKDTPLSSLLEEDFALSIDGTRLRCKIFRQRGGVGLILRGLGRDLPSLDTLEIPPEMGALCLRPGLILCTGPQRAEILAALAAHHNAHAQGHIILLESPLEYLQDDGACLVTQREVGVDTSGWLEGLRAALGQDPDLVGLGEVPDSAVAELALRASEEGQTVLAALPVARPEMGSAWLEQLFGPERRPEIRSRLEEAVVASMGLGLRGFQVEGPCLAASAA